MFNTGSSITFNREIDMMGDKCLSSVLPLYFNALGRDCYDWVESDFAQNVPKNRHKMKNFKELKKARKQKKLSRRKNR